MYNKKGLFRVMSINAINGISLYEYYYTINQEARKKKASPIAREMKEYGLTPTDDEALNVALLNQAKKAQTKDEQETTESYSDRPWADLMYQLNIQFNPDPKDDIQDIKDEIANLVKGFDDEELINEVQDLEDYAQKLYLNYQQNYSGSISSFDTLGSQLSNISMLNKVNLL